MQLVIRGNPNNCCCEEIIHVQNCYYWILIDIFKYLNEQVFNLVEIEHTSNVTKIEQSIIATYKLY